MTLPTNKQPAAGCFDNYIADVTDPSHRDERLGIRNRSRAGSCRFQRIYSRKLEGVVVSLILLKTIYFGPQAHVEAFLPHLAPSNRNFRFCGLALSKSSSYQWIRKTRPFSPSSGRVQNRSRQAVKDSAEDWIVVRHRNNESLAKNPATSQKSPLKVASNPPFIETIQQRTSQLFSKSSQPINAITRKEKEDQGELDGKTPAEKRISKLTQSIVESAIRDILQTRAATTLKSSAAPTSSGETASKSLGMERRLNQASSSALKDSGIIPLLPLDRTEAGRLSQLDTGAMEIRVATPSDDEDIARLRLSVFSGCSTELQNQFCTRSCQALASRRQRGALTLVATTTEAALPTSPKKVYQGDRRVDMIMRKPMIVASVECSFHEFEGTQLGQRRPKHAMWYITEVAVHPSFRRQGLASQLLKEVDRLALSASSPVSPVSQEAWSLYPRHEETMHSGKVETLYLHVDVKNAGALALYRKAGYHLISGPGDHVVVQDDNDVHPKQQAAAMYLEFTTSLNLHPGAIPGREHYLMAKHLTEQPTWLSWPRRNRYIGVDPIYGNTPRGTAVATTRTNLGFEIPGLHLE